LGLQYDPSLQFTEAVVEPEFERRPDWWIFESLAQHMGLQSAFDTTDTPNMWGRVDAMLGSQGRSMTELREQQVIALERSTPEEFFQRIQHADKRIDCFPEVFAVGVERMQKIFVELQAEPSNQLKLISKRDGYMMNSWYSNIDKLKTKDRAQNYLFMNPGDAELRQISDGDQVNVANEFGQLQTTVKLTDDLMSGVVAMTHGWGHSRSTGMKVAQNKPGVNSNVLLPSGPDSFDPLSNQSHMTGVRVDVGLAVGA
jgi:anaerobic selenocysteine-containing dehydrogenase